MRYYIVIDYPEPIPLDSIVDKTWDYKYIELGTMVSLTLATEAARVFSLYPFKGKDVIVLDENGKPIHVYSNGKRFY